jgi:hypothetical protein
MQARARKCGLQARYRLRAQTYLQAMRDIAAVVLVTPAACQHIGVTAGGRA